VCLHNAQIGWLTLLAFACLPASDVTGIDWGIRTEEGTPFMENGWQSHSRSCAQASSASCVWGLDLREQAPFSPLTSSITITHNLI